MTRELVFMRDVICVYHPLFAASSDLRRTGMRFPHVYKIERLIEESLAAVGGYDFVDAAHYDFSDHSDSKTCSVSAQTRRLTIKGVEGKIGALRVIAFNPHCDRLDYFYINRSAVEQMKANCYGRDQFKQRIMATWNSQTDHYNRLEQFRMTNFEKVAMARD